MNHRRGKPVTKMTWVVLVSTDRGTLGWSVDPLANGIPVGLHSSVGGSFITGIRCHSQRLATVLSALDATAVLPTTSIVRDAGWYGRLEDLVACLSVTSTTELIPMDCHWEHGLHVSRVHHTTLQLLNQRPRMRESLVHTSLVRCVALRGKQRNRRDPVLGPWLEAQPVHNAIAYTACQRTPKPPQAPDGVEEGVELRDVPAIGCHNPAQSASPM